MIDLLSLRRRPSGWPVLHQRWQRLVFLHWRLRPDKVRTHVPDALELDLFEGTAWASVVAFAVTRMRPTLLPPIPGLSEAHQVNARTYVHRDGVPGLWFFSLDADNALAVAAARAAYQLPYYRARMTVTSGDDAVTFRCDRTDSRAPARVRIPRPRTLRRLGASALPVPAARRTGGLAPTAHRRFLPARPLRAVCRPRCDAARTHPPPAVAVASSYPDATVIDDAGIGGYGAREPTSVDPCAGGAIQRRHLAARATADCFRPFWRLRAAIAPKIASPEGAAHSAAHDVQARRTELAFAGRAVLPHARREYAPDDGATAIVAFISKH